MRSLPLRNDLLALALTAVAAAPAVAQGAGSDFRPHPFEVGRPFPDRVLPAAEDGTPRSLADFRGEKLVLHVFASW